VLRVLAELEVAEEKAWQYVAEILEGFRDAGTIDETIETLPDKAKDA